MTNIGHMNPNKIVTSKIQVKVLGTEWVINLPIDYDIRTIKNIKTKK